MRTSTPARRLIAGVTAGAAAAATAAVLLLAPTAADAGHTLRIQQDGHTLSNSQFAGDAKVTRVKLD